MNQYQLINKNLKNQQKKISASFKDYLRIQIRQSKRFEFSHRQAKTIVYG